MNKNLNHKGASKRKGAAESEELTEDGPAIDVADKGMAKKKGAFKKITGSLQFLILKLWSMLKQFRKYFIIGLDLLAFIEVINLVRTYVFKEIIDNFIYTDKDLLLRRLAILIVIMGFVYLIQSINNFSVNYLLAKTDIKISNFFTALVLKKNLDLSLHYHER